MRLSPTFRLTLSMALITVSLVLFADLAGFVPDARFAALEIRKRSCESLAVQLSIAVTRSDIDLVKQTLDVFATRNPDVLSAAIRRADGSIFSETPEHAKYWSPPDTDRSTLTHVLVPVFAGEQRWGAVEVSFAPVYQGVLGWLRHSVWGLALFTGMIGLGIFYVTLRRALRELDPRGTIPQRIRSAFDALAEGVLILDRDGFIVLANAVFAQKCGRSADALIGIKAAQLEWLDAVEKSKPKILPWAQTLTAGETQARAFLRLAASGQGETQVFVINSTPILDERHQPRGAIVTFDDVTALEKKNQELNSTIDLLKESEREIKNKNEELYQLATRDPLTGCLNRRAFFAMFEPLCGKTETEGMALSCLMIDIDYFKLINDRFGHDIGDKVLHWVAENIQSLVDDSGSICRYGGEEFCVVLPGLDVFQADVIGQRLCRAIEEKSTLRFGSELAVTISVGLSSAQSGVNTSSGLITQADQALYAAKSTGRNRVVQWSSAIEAPADLQPSLRRAGERVGLSSVLDASQRITPAPMEQALSASGASTIMQRMEFIDWMERALREGHRQTHKSVAVMSLVPNQFRRVSDTLGASVGDTLLQVIGNRLQDELRQIDAAASAGKFGWRVSRLRLDEIGIVISGIAGKDEVRSLLNRIFRALSQPLEMHGHMIEVGVSIGVALTPEGGDTPEMLLKNAAAARYYAQERHRDERCEFYSDEMHVSSMRRARIVGELQQALDNDQFVLHFQPQQDLRTGEIVSWEALLRWPHPQLGPIPPAELIPIAEQTGLIHGLGRWVLRASCRQAKAWSDAGFGVGRIAVNLSAIQLRHADIVDQVREVLLETGLAPNRLELEITESAIMHDPSVAQRTLQQLREIGIRIAIDDFGIGYSGLSYIKDFPVDVVKIDRSFLISVADPRAGELYAGIVDMAQRLNLYIVAEGVEAQTDLDFVKHCGCHAIQGYLFSAPVPATQVERILPSSNGSRPEPAWQSARASKRSIS
ncbi:MAG: EAL domain-containing protein [Gammaproteobacteria bacterium]|nr:EAL domain-containing protein [Gammaproteobacteria bacterium]